MPKEVKYTRYKLVDGGNIFSTQPVNIFILVSPNFIFRLDIDAHRYTEVSYLKLIWLSRKSTKKMKKKLLEPGAYSDKNCLASNFFANDLVC